VSMFLKLLQLEVSVKTILVGLVALYLVVLSAGFLFLGSNSLFDGTTASLGLALGVFVLVSLWSSPASMFPQVAMLTLYFLLYGFPRIAGYLLWPDAVTFPFGEGIGKAEINLGLLYILAGTVVILVGILLADTLTRNHAQVVSSTPILDDDHPLAALFMAFITVMLFDWFTTVFLDVSNLGKLRLETGNSYVQLLKGLFGFDMAYFVVLIALFLRGRKEQGTYLMIVICSVLYILYSSFLGSRSTGLRVLLMLFAILIATRPSFKAPLIRYCSIILILIVASLCVYPLATQRRFDINRQYQKTLDKVPPQERTRDGTDLYGDIPRLFITLSNRFQLIDYSILVLSQKGNPEEKSKYMKLDYALKSIMNYIVPGVIFQEAELDTSRVLAIIYRGFSEDYVKSHGHFSEFWTGWGLAYVLFGWYGGLAALCFAGFVLQLFYVLVHVISGKYRAYLASWYILLAPMLVYASSGLDHTVTTAGVLLLQTTVVVILLSLWGTAFRWVRSPSRSNVTLPK